MKTEVLSVVRKRVMGIDNPDLALTVTQGPSTIKEYANKPMEVWCVATDDTVDEEREVIMPDGIDMSYLLARKTVYVDHTYALPNTVAKLRNIIRKGRGWESHNQILDADTQETKAIKALAVEGMLCQSISVHRLDSGKPTPTEAAMYQGATRITRKSKAVELSFTAWPVNPSCVQVAMKSQAAKDRLERVKAVFKSIDAKENVYDLFSVPRGRVYFIS